MSLKDRDARCIQLTDFLVNTLGRELTGEETNLVIWLSIVEGDMYGTLNTLLEELTVNNTN